MPEVIFSNGFVDNRTASHIGRIHGEFSSGAMAASMSYRDSSIMRERMFIFVVFAVHRSNVIKIP